MTQQEQIARAIGVCSVLALLVIAGFVTSLILGETNYPLSTVIPALLGSSDADPTATQIIQRLRLPVAVCALLIGANLAASGVLLQGVMRNPLAAPNIVGVTAGAGLGATIILALRPDWINFLPFAAFLGAFAATLIVYALSWQPGTGTSPVRMILAGVAITAMLSALTTFIMLRHPERIASVAVWMAGSLNSIDWEATGFFDPDEESRFISPLNPDAWRGIGWYTVFVLPLAFLLCKPLDLFALGESRAKTLGVSVERVRFFAIAAAALLAGAAVSIAGLIGFVGLIIPHAARILVGPKHFTLLIASTLGGAALLLWADVLTRTAVSTPIPVGIVTALLGGPYFLMLLHRARMVR
ncbi:MAG: iron ABC transporter permease [Planctomycetota bacterium]